MQRLSPRWLLLGFGLLTAAAACGVSSGAASMGRGRPNAGGTGTTTGTGGSTGGGGIDPSNPGSRDAAPPPETEVEKAFEAPVATERYVWATNPKTGRVALIDATTFQVK